ncbi:hypothetical protein ALC60_10152 [Trachymyrmex zeteki]|uniref:PiggyBac transposable element-derived protein 4 n=1 Tax=Mycetomoellerius zeteki TaxID=64791 RepID=A0A151WSB9_9HYME|nr:hypothetical protein ALC60_10152 [Trachymyrmex zeteki]
MSYNTYKGATDTFDKKCHHFTTTRRTRRWSLRFFYNMLDQAGINSCTLHNLKAENPKLNRSKFLKELAKSLVEPHLRRRFESQTVRTSIKKIIMKVLDMDMPVAPTLNVILSKSESVDIRNIRARYALCDNDASGRTHMKCPNCLRRMCDEHRAPVCIECECFNNNNNYYYYVTLDKVILDIKKHNFIQ